jgi:predicted ATPase
MLTRLKVSGFKNLMDIDISFGPFTCIAGGNGVGKSNLFDAIAFLSALADKPILDAARSVRGGDGPLMLFHKVGQQWDRNMRFEAEMIIPSQGTGPLGERVKARSSYLRYSLELSNPPMERAGKVHFDREPLEIVSESLDPIPGVEVSFDSAPAWRKSAFIGRRTAPLISTSGKGVGSSVRFHPEGKAGALRTWRARQLPRTLLSTADDTHPTALLARQEMRSWRLLQLEPSALRAPDDLSEVSRLAANGAHVPSTLNRLLSGNAKKAPAIRARIVNRLAELAEGIQDVDVELYEPRDELSLWVSRDGTRYGAPSLSDGTLRFLALCVLEQDPEAQGLLCLEEPENGIHPERIEAMIDLLRDLAVDTSEPVGPDNPLRQVIINTHSPVVVGLVPDDSLIVASREPRVEAGRRYSTASFRWLDGTWRARAWPERHTVARGKLLSYLSSGRSPNGSDGGEAHRVIDREDIHAVMFPKNGLSES